MPLQAHDRLREHFDASGFERLAQAIRDEHVVVAPDDALVRVLIHLDAAAAAILRGLAGRFGSGERVAEPAFVARESARRRRKSTAACGTLCTSTDSAAHALAELLGDPPPLRERRARHVNGEAVAGEMAGARALRQLRGLQRAADFGDGAIADGESRELVEDVELIHVAVEHAAGQPIVRFLRADLPLERAPVEQGRDGVGRIEARLAERSSSVAATSFGRCLGRRAD